MIDQRLNETRIFLVEIQEIVYSLLQTSLGEQSILDHFDLSQFVCTKAFLGLYEFRLDFFKAVDDLLGLGADQGPQGFVDLLRLNSHLVKNCPDVVDGLRQGQVPARVPEYPVIKEKILVFKKIFYV